MDILTTRKTLSEEHKRKISKALIGNKNAKGNKGNTRSDETKRKISATRLGIRFSEETKKKMSEAQKGNQNRKGKPCSKETRRRISESLKGNRLSEETKRKIGDAHRGKHHSEETKRKISETRLGISFSKEHRQKISEANQNPKGYHQSKEYKQKMRRNRLKQTLPQKETLIEIVLQEELNRRGIVYQKHLPVCGICQPDIVFPELKIAVFADGDYWHSKDFKNGAVWNRDRRQDYTLRENGWEPLRFWGHEIRENVESCVDEIIGEMRWLDV